MIRSIAVLFLCVAPLAATASASVPESGGGAGFRLSTHQGPALSMCLLFGADRHLLVQAEPGLGGGKLSIGYFQSEVVDHALKLSVFRSWDDPIGVEPHQTYVGVEYEVGFGVNVSVGVFGLAAGDFSDRRALLMFGIGVGF